MVLRALKGQRLGGAWRLQRVEAALITRRSRVSRRGAPPSSRRPAAKTTGGARRTGWSNRETWSSVTGLAGASSRNELVVVKP